MRFGYIDQKTIAALGIVIQDFDVLDQGLITSISKFNWLWPCFEARHCGTNANRAALETFSQLPAHGQNAQEQANQVAIAHFRSRFSIERHLNSLVGPDRNAKAPIVLGISNGATHAQLTFGLALIVYRLRNNLFHGTKGVEGIGNQQANFTSANNLLCSWLSIP